MQRSESIKELAAALAKAQAEFKPVSKTREVDFNDKNGRRVHYFYADLQDVINMSQPILAKHGLSFIQTTSFGDGNEMTLETMLMHSSGEFIIGHYPVRIMQRPQEQGSEITYARRYTLSPMLGIHSEEDDDGAAANEGDRATPKPIQAAKPIAPLAAKEYAPDFGQFKGQTVAQILAKTSIQEVDKYLNQLNAFIQANEYPEMHNKFRELMAHIDKYVAKNSHK